MKLSQGFWQTYKESPNDAEIISHKLMVRAGLIHKMSSGIYTYLPMMNRVLHKVTKIIRDELEKANCYEVMMSVVTPSELWKESGRWDDFGPEILKATDRAERELCLSPTNEESVVDVFRKSIKSYKQLPVNLYQINTKFRDEIRPRFGVMRGREFTMKDAYSFHTDKECLDKVYEDMYQVYGNVCKRMGLSYIAVEADAGAMAQGNAKTHEFQVLANSGEDKVVRCNNCDYAANLEKASTSAATFNSFTNGELTLINTPGKQTIEDVCAFLSTDTKTSIKSLVYKSVTGEDEEFILALVVGDDSLNEIKLKNFLKPDHLLPASDEELKKLEMLKGFIGPVGLKKKARIIFDSEIKKDGHYTIGANELDKHYQGFNLGRDLKEDYEVTDLREAKSGDKCSLCGTEGSIEEIRGIEVGHIFQLGDKYTKSMNATVLDQNGKALHPLMGCYGIGVTRIVAAAIEQHHDENGIIWPASISPYHVYFASICKSEEYKQISNDIFDELKKEQIEVIYDDRKAGPGHKFKDADLLGCPFTLVFGERDYKDSKKVEIRRRNSEDKVSVTREELIPKLKELIQFEVNKFEL